MIARLTGHVRRFTDREDGYTTLESIIALPVLFWIFGATWVWHDYTRQSMLEQRINYTVGDMISRETDPIDDNYIDSTYDLVLAMLGADASEADLRITIVKQTRNVDSGSLNYETVWSQSRGGRPALAGNLNNMSEILPVMARSDQVIVVETWRDYAPAFSTVGLDRTELTSYSFTRPRFAPQVIGNFSGDGNGNSNQNNGWGNGDQDAPGNSLCNNNAENWDEGAAAEECADNADGSNDNEGRRGRSRRS